MKRIFSILLVLAVLMFSFCIFAGSEKTYITDDANLLTSTQENELLNKIIAIRDEYSFDIVIHTTNDIGFKSVAEYAEDYFYDNGYGVGANRDGLIFMLNMGGGVGNRDYYSFKSGFARTAFMDYALYDENSYINSAVLGYLVEGDYYGAFDKYLELADVFLRQAKAGEPYDYSNKLVPTSTKIAAEVAVIAVALVIATVAVAIMKRKMNNAIEKSGALEYVVSDSVNIYGRSDTLVNTTVTKTPKAPPPSAKSTGGGFSGGGSSGMSHSGGGGKF